ncbi:MULTISPECIES: hypothetical protein [unclassified Gilliamella]|uniref:hypothetical protein n=1 Tax=unclassified Gilliamella TaxID=2685620 RepID=UPI00226A639A|nr:MULTISPECIES: hypothetical protein [unclassified Gilliamella]MCX8574560.1 hypothetical protein [Gilliamella sp. B3831]MCX8576791.1 hypothetical protein [Gilliamella sp. B3815]MCX8589227.1 hypothetical protein [Gilliamella sp. B3812]MCX8603801.1 hypothetical protein [Gilliamella sp. B3823]MCX8606681.1 hypothetical protein [Gilliamella sp. B3825]
MTWITTHSGLHFDYQNPIANAICIEDIAKGLSHECRFTGQLDRFYSVAQHSVECSYIVPDQFKLEALLHDAVEAYCKDIPSPLKKLLPDYQKIENYVDLIIRQKFNLPVVMSAEVKRADLILLATEHRDIANDGKEWPMLRNVPLLNKRIEPLPSNVAYNLFLERFIELCSLNTGTSI